MTNMRPISGSLRSRRLPRRPSWEDTTGAPTVHAWLAIEREGHTYLVGNIYGLPTVPEGHLSATERILYVDRERGLARAGWRWYRLGSPA